MMSGRICIACSMLLSALPLLVEGGFPKAAKTTLNFTLNAEPKKTEANGRLVLSLEKGAKIGFRGHCEGTTTVSLRYWLITTHCVGLLDSANFSVLRNPNRTLLQHKTKAFFMDLHCNDNGGSSIFPENMTSKWRAAGNDWNALCGRDEGNATSTSPPLLPTVRSTASALQTAKASLHPLKTKGKRGVTTTTISSAATVSTINSVKNKMGTFNSDILCKTRTADVHALVFEAVMVLDKKSTTDYATVQITVKMKNEWGYLSAIDHPNLAFYATMTALYSVLAFVWLVLLMMQYQDLLRIQFWIGGVIGLGMFEKALFLAEYNTVNENGNESRELMVFAELVSTAKRTLARLLVIIVSMGFGIVKPRLGPMLPRVLAVGALYFVAGSIDSTGRAMHNSETAREQQDLATTLVLTVVDVGICWWIFLSLHSTMRTLRLRRNLIKLSLYRHFTNALVFCVIASVAFMVWDLRQYRLTKCITDWSELWLRAGFWHILFSFILIIIMILWRPTANNNRYAYSPLIDLGSNDEPEQMPSDAFEGMKLRNVGGQVEKKSPRSVDDDLKWVEENIPTATAESALPSLLDSDEELMTTKFEMSKIQ